MRQAINELYPAADYILVDGWRVPDVPLPQTNIIGGDAISSSIAAASVIAKVTRDHIMVGFDKIYPHYHFAKNKGYGTPEHILAINKFGYSPIHRTSFHISGGVHGGLLNGVDGEGES
jgi:ribonuclease HII